MILTKWRSPKRRLSLDKSLAVVGIALETSLEHMQMIYRKPAGKASPIFMRYFSARKRFLDTSFNMKNIINGEI